MPTHDDDFQFEQELRRFAPLDVAPLPVRTAARPAVRWLAIAAAILIVASGLAWRLFTTEHRIPTNAVTGNTHNPAETGNVSAMDRPIGQPLAESSLLSDGKPFLALPAFAFVTPEEDLRVIRVEMPVSSLRLLGARVNDELVTQRIVADLLVGADGTPYAFRLVS